jgi:hypothetical protein
MHPSIRSWARSVIFGFLLTAPGGKTEAVTGVHGIVASGHPLVTDADGYALRGGFNAVGATVAEDLTPQWWTAARRRLQPARATCLFGTVGRIPV